MYALRRTTLALGVAALAAACSDSRTPTAPTALEQSPATPSAARPTTANPLAGIPILTTGGTLVGNLTITALNVVNGVLVASGSFTNALTGITTTVTNLPVSLLTQGAGGACQILTLHIGAIDLNLLGLLVNLAPVDLDISAQPGPGNLLGNLLCAVTHLLDNGGALSALTNLLNQINALLGGL